MKSFRKISSLIHIPGYGKRQVVVFLAVSDRHSRLKRNRVSQTSKNLAASLKQTTIDHSHPRFISQLSGILVARPTHSFSQLFHHFLILRSYCMIWKVSVTFRQFYFDITSSVGFAEVNLAFQGKTSFFKDNFFFGISFFLYI